MDKTQLFLVSKKLYLKFNPLEAEKSEVLPESLVVDWP